MGSPATTPATEVKEDTDQVRTPATEVKDEAVVPAVVTEKVEDTEAATED